MGRPGPPAPKSDWAAIIESETEIRREVHQGSHSSQSAVQASSGTQMRAGGVSLLELDLRAMHGLGFLRRSGRRSLDLDASKRVDELMLVGGGPAIV